MNSPDDSNAILPTPEIVSASNVGRWMSELGFATYDELHQFSVIPRSTYFYLFYPRLRLVPGIIAESE